MWDLSARPYLTTLTRSLPMPSSLTLSCLTNVFLSESKAMARIPVSKWEVRMILIRLETVSGIS